ncbi:MAG: DUF5069 domain-containing protein [Chloroflexota bacterium]|jgi:hypothetical protein|nr:DUF5069 domain-containing protein [Chloroflexota bacterium]MDP6509368.1 DUF5069 domain-containing protein [Chloroflexota bacterium]MDP6756808.1 DUF5069 domain-containing protein [Chloroflexota bacterium]
MDLTREYPRSPGAELHGIAFIPRAIDKGRADLAGTVGEYFSRIGFSKVLTDFLEIDIDEFVEALAELPDDEAVWGWVSTRMAPRTAAEIAEFNQGLLDRKANPDFVERHRGFLEPMGLAHLADKISVCERLDLEEGRSVPGIENR